MKTIQLIKLPVFTESGTKIGRIKDIALDKSTQVVEQYMVHTGDFLPHFFTQELLVHRSQVVGITEKGMVVKDSAIKERGMSGQVAVV